MPDSAEKELKPIDYAITPKCFESASDRGVVAGALFDEIESRVPVSQKDQSSFVREKLLDHLSEVREAYLQKHAVEIEAIREKQSVGETLTPTEKDALKRYEGIDNLAGSLSRHIGEASTYTSLPDLLQCLLILVHRFEGGYDRLGPLDSEEKTRIARELLLEVAYCTGGWHNRASLLVQSLAGLPKSLNQLLWAVRSERVERLDARYNPYRDVHVRAQYAEWASREHLGGEKLQKKDAHVANHSRQMQYPEEIVANLYRGFDDLFSAKGFLKALMSYVCESMAFSQGIVLDEKGHVIEGAGLSIPGAEALNQALAGILGLPHHAITSLESPADVQGSLQCFQVSFAEDEVLESTHGLSLDFIQSELKTRLLSEGYWVVSSEAVGRDASFEEMLRFKSPLFLGSGVDLNAEEAEKDFSWARRVIMRGASGLFPCLEGIGNKMPLLETLVRGRCVEAFEYFDAKGWMTWGDVHALLISNAPGTEGTYFAHLLMNPQGSGFVRAICEFSLKKTRSLDALETMLCAPQDEGGLSNFQVMITQKNVDALRVVMGAFLSQGSTGFEALQRVLLKEAQVGKASHLGQMLFSNISPNLIACVCEEIVRQEGGGEVLEAMLCAPQYEGGPSHFYMMIAQNNVGALRVVMCAFLEKGSTGLQALQRVLLKEAQVGKASHLGQMLCSNITSNLIACVCEEIVRQEGGLGALEEMFCAPQYQGGPSNFNLMIAQKNVDALRGVVRAFLSQGSGGLQALQRVLSKGYPNGQTLAQFNRILAGDKPLNEAYQAALEEQSVKNLLRASFFAGERTDALSQAATCFLNEGSKEKFDAFKTAYSDSQPEEKKNFQDSLGYLSDWWEAHPVLMWAVVGTMVGAVVLALCTLYSCVKNQYADSFQAKKPIFPKTAGTQLAFLMDKHSPGSFSLKS